MIQQALILLVLLSTLQQMGSASAVPRCSQQPLPNLELCCTPAQVIYLLDYSKSISDSPALNATVLNFIKRSRCMFPETTTKSAVIVFNSQVEVGIPMGTYGSDEWYTKVDALVSTGLTTQSKYTPMAEALYKARRVFNSSATQCGTNRLVILLSDGRPFQNMPATTQYDDNEIPRTWLYKNGPNGPDSADYAESVVPEQARLLKQEYKARIIVVALNSGDSVQNNARLDYFKGIITPQFQCGKTPKIDGVQYTMGSCTGLTQANTQCYQARVTSGDNYGSATFANKYMECAERDMTGFPIATDEAHVVTVQSSGDLLSQAIDGTGPLACPYHG